MKKLFAGLLLCAIALGLLGCSDTDKEVNNENKQEQTQLEQTQEQILADNDYCKITYTGISVDSFYNAEVVNLVVENKADYTISFNIENADIDGTMNYVMPSMQPITAGNKANVQLVPTDGVTKIGTMNGDFVMLKVTNSDGTNFDCEVIENIHFSINK